jgi:endonuclease-3
VNKVTPDLFRKYASAQAFADAVPAELEQDIRSTGFYRNKAKSIIGACTIITTRHGGNVPADMAALTLLPGVGRKTANCVLGGAYGIQSGIVVDTHVHRLSERLGLSKKKTPERIENELMKLVPKKEWYRFSNLLILHGRATCNARKPLCESCAIADLCPSSTR